MQRPLALMGQTTVTVCACSPPHCKHMATPLMSPHCTSHFIVSNETISISHSSSLALHPPPPVLLLLSLHLLFSSRMAHANRPRKPNSPSFHSNKPVPSLSSPLPPVPQLFLSLFSLCPLLSLPPPLSNFSASLSLSLCLYCWWLVGFTAPLFWYLHISGGCRVQRLSGERTLSLPLPNASLHLPTHTHIHTHIWGERQ